MHAKITADHLHPSIGSVIWRLHCVTHALAGSETMPAISTRRVDSSMMKNTANRVRPAPVQTSTVKKSAAASTSQCVRRKSC